MNCNKAMPHEWYPFELVRNSQKQKVFMLYCKQITLVSKIITFQQLPLRAVINHLLTPMEGCYTSLYILKVFFLQIFHILLHRNPSSVDIRRIACNLQCPTVMKPGVGIFSINATLHCKIFPNGKHKFFR